MTTRLLAGILAFSAASMAAAQERYHYADTRGRTILFPRGAVSFADEVVDYNSGRRAPSEARRNPSVAIGEPHRARGYVSLGCGGSLTLRFIDNALIDVPGPDLYVYEVGRRIEGTRLEISSDNSHWIQVGEIGGGTAEVDIAGSETAGQAFSYVRLFDLETSCSGGSPGADINAVGAIGAARRLTLRNQVLFDVDQSVLRPDASETLSSVVSQVLQSRPARLVIEGHTDNVASDEYNLLLSRERAEAVAAFITTQSTFPIDVLTTGHGESRPIAGNNTEEGRARNRRVEILLIETNGEDP
ncbi:MAG: hypothetical protein A4S17_10155 [Proteobacteria bacterium HN_bin10]|nr:MAG: hypothetical protein A4S17_10155 [Proteobacteria bacterium HN_bin10]